MFLCVVAALAALAQDNRLDVFRLLVQTGAGGLPAGGIAERLGIAPQSGRWSRARASNPDVVLGVLAAIMAAFPPRSFITAGRSP
jgi:hypothetical protein